MSKNSPNKSGSGSPMSGFGDFREAHESSHQRVHQAPSNPGTPSRGVYGDENAFEYRWGDTPSPQPYYSPTNQGSRTSASPPPQNAAQQGASRQDSQGRLAPPPQNTGRRGDSETRGRPSARSSAAGSSTGSNNLRLEVPSPVSFDNLTNRSRSGTGTPNTPITTQPPGPPAFLTMQPTGSQSQGHAMPQSAYSTARVTQPTVHPDFHTMRATGSQYHSHTMPPSASSTLPVDQLPVAKVSSEQAQTPHIPYNARSIESLQRDYDAAPRNEAGSTANLAKLKNRIRNAHLAQGSCEKKPRDFTNASDSPQLAKLKGEMEQAKADQNKPLIATMKQRIKTQRFRERAKGYVADPGVQGGPESRSRQNSPSLGRSPSPGIGSSRQAGGPRPAQNLHYPYAPASPPASGTAAGLNDDLYSDDRPTPAVNTIPRVTRPGSRGGSRPPPASRGASPAARSGSRPPRTEDNRGRREASRSRSGSQPASQSRGRAPPAAPQTVGASGSWVGGASGSWTGTRRPTNSSPPATLSKAEIAARKKDDKAKADQKKADEKQRAKDEKKRKAEQDAEEKKAKKKAQEKKSPKPQPKPKPGPSGGGKRK